MIRGRGTLLRLRDLFKGTVPADGDVLTWNSARKMAEFVAASGGGGFSGTMTFYASSTSGGATDQLQTVVILDGRIQSWTQGSGGGGGTAGEAIGLLLALTKAA